VRHQYALGVICGAAFALAASAALVSAGLVDTADLSTDRAPEIRAWDTHGTPDRSRWTRIDAETHSLDSVRHLYVTNGAVAMSYAGSRLAPFAFSLSMLGAPTSDLTRLPKLLPTEEGIDPGEATVELPSNQELVVHFANDGSTVQAFLQAGTFGYRLKVKPKADRVREGPSLELPVAVFVPPYVVFDGASVQASAAMRADAKSLSMSPGRGFALRLIGSRPFPFLMSRIPARLDLSPDRAGFSTVATVRGTSGQLDLFIGLLRPGVHGPGFEVRGAAPRPSRATRDASFVDALLTHGEWAVRSLELSRGELVPPLPAGATMRTQISLTGPPSGFANVNEQALVALGS
jgi:hypothetical protein